MIKLLKLHIIILILLSLPGLMVPVSLLTPIDFFPDIVGIIAMLYAILWVLHTLITSLFMGGLVFFRFGRTEQAVISTHGIIFILMLAYAILLLSS
jgi:hypothetical protein